MWWDDHLLLDQASALRRQPKLNAHSDVILDEQHATVWPAAVTRGLVHLYRTDGATL